MLRALINLFRGDDPLGEMGQDFGRMLESTYEMTLYAGEIFFTGRATAEERTALYKTDVKVNQLERKIRKRVVAHLSLPGNQYHVPYGLALMSLIKDVERLGDYAKNLAEVIEIHPGDLPDDDVVSELREIRVAVENDFQAAIGIFGASDTDRAVALIQQQRNLARRCDNILHAIARGDYDPATTTALVLGARYYKRISGHVLNVLTAVVMPLHKMDYYDEDEIPEDEDAD